MLFPLLVLVVIQVLLPLTCGFEIAYVLEPFEPIADVAVDADVLSDFEVEASSGSVTATTNLTTQALFGSQALNITLAVVGEDEGAANDTTAPQVLSVESVLSSRTHKCHGAQELSLWYQIHQLDAGDDIIGWRIFLLLEQDPLSNDLEVWEVEVTEYEYSVDQTWTQLRVPLNHFQPSDKDQDSTENPLMNLNRIKGWRMELETAESVSLLLDQLSLVGGGDLLGAAFYEGSWDEAEKDEALQVIYHSSNISRDEAKEVLNGDGSFGIDYTLEQRETWGGFVQYQHIPPGRAYYNLSTAQALSFQYDTTQPASVIGRAHLRLIMLDASDCVEGCGYDAAGLENYYSFHSVLDKRENGRVALELYYDNNSGEAFVWDGWYGIVGNSQLDKDIVKGFKFEFSVDSQGDIGSLITGSVTISNLLALESFEGNEVDSEACTVEPDLRIRDFRNTFRRIEFQSHGECCQACKDDPTCHYAVAHGRDCYLKDDKILPQDIELRNENVNLLNTLVFIKDAEETAGNFCQRCACNEETRSIDCRGQDLVFSPVSFTETWAPQTLDLRNNPRLLILSSRALNELPSLSELLLPGNLTFIPPNIVDNNKQLEKVSFEEVKQQLVNRKPLNAIMAPTEEFGDICCGKGLSMPLVSTQGTKDLTFCDLKEDEPGIDAVYEDFIQYHQAEMLQYLRPSSPFMFEAAESPQKCAQYCHIDSECRYFQYDARLTVAEHSCALFSNQGTPMRVCCDREHYEDPDLGTPGWVAGYVPQTRHEVDNARVLVKPSLPKMEATEANGYKASYLVRLGAMPMRGAVWVEPKVATAAGTKLSFSPPRVVLYDNETVAEVTIEVTNAADIKKGGTVVITSVVEACDTAFLTSNTCSASDDLAIYLDVVTPTLMESSHVITMAVVIPLAVLLLFITSLWALSEYKRRQTDSIWQIRKEELQFDDPPQVVARGRFGNVLIAQWRGTVVAVKRVIPPESGHKQRRGSEKLRINEAFDKSYSLMLSSKGTSSIGASCMVDPSGTLGEDDVELGSIHSKSSAGCGESTSHTRPLRARRNSFMRASHLLDSIRRKPKTSQSTISSIDGSRKQFWEHKLRVKLDDYASLQANFVQEMRHLSRLRHPCIIAMMGAVIDQNTEPMLVMEYMDHGSLKDLLQNQTLLVEDEHILAILSDITQGLRFLHESEVIHGDLKAKNILVDSRLRAKVADFGFCQWQSKSKRLGATGSPLWMAPELLRGESINTVQSDAFSFGVILHEVYAKADPYEEENLFEVLDAIIDPRIKKRPEVPTDCPEEIQRMMKNCYEDNPSLRPTFEQMDMQLREIKVEHLSKSDPPPEESGGKHDIPLLDEVFPPHVANAFREGRKVEPETKEMTTILFMDVVGFTRISSGLSPLQVSNMLHRLYTKLDALSQDYAVFKMETVGDCWMGVTNLTRDQDNDHVKRIADFAVAALKAASETWIDEENHSLGRVKMRGGFHSGPVVANVVGSRSPRLALFGDTVNTALRMETQSESGKIQCSDVSATLLESQDPSSQFTMRPRGLQHIAGKGLMMTFYCDQL